MAGPHPAVAQARSAVRAVLSDLATYAADDPTPYAQRTAPADAPLVWVACSGGRDSLALVAATAFVAPRLGVRAGALVVDHGLQPGSSDVAQRAAAQCADLGLDPVRVERVTVEPAGEGPEAAARTARHEAFARVLEQSGACRVLVAHTRDDQAEQVLLGLARGSGTRSVAGIPPSSGAVVRPFLGLTREQTSTVCAEHGLTWWDDPHNDDGTYTRVRARRVLPELEAALGPGITEALARTADLARADADALDALAARALGDLGRMPWTVRVLAALDPAVRTRCWRQALGRDLTAGHVVDLEALVTDWRGQGPVHLPGARKVWRADGAIYAEPQGAGLGDALALEPDDVELDRLYGRVDPLTIPQARALLEGFRHRWWVAGGRAIAAVTGERRRHHDLDVSILRQHVEAFVRHCDGTYDVWAAAQGSLTPLRPGRPLPEGCNNVWLRDGAGAPWVLDVQLSAGDDAEWVYRRDPGVRAPWSEVLVERDGVDYLRPHVQMLFKSTHRRPKDEADLEAVVPSLSAAERQWLAWALRRADRDHPWLARLR